MCFHGAGAGPLTASRATDNTILLRATVDLFGFWDNLRTAGRKVSCGREAFVQLTLSHLMNLQRTLSGDDIKSLILRLFCKREAVSSWLTAPILTGTPEVLLELGEDRVGRKRVMAGKFTYCRSYF